MTKLWQSRISIITGGYGSGKTEVAINLSLFKRRCYGGETAVSLVDLDIVNPYFRSRDKIDSLEQLGVTVVAPSGELRHADLPALPPGISGILRDPYQQVVLDVGGDPAGATVLGRFHQDLPESSYEMIFVVNPYRPYTNNADAVIELMRAIEFKARLRVTALCNNTNLMGLTTAEDVLGGHNLLLELEARTGLPTAFVSCMTKLAPQVNFLLPNIPVMPLELNMLPPWAIHHQ